MDAFLKTNCGYELGGFDLYCVCFNGPNDITCSSNTLLPNSCENFQALCKSHCDGRKFENSFDLCSSGTGNDHITLPDAIAIDGLSEIVQSINETFNTMASRNSTIASFLSAAATATASNVSPTSPVVNSTPKEQSSSQPNISLPSMMLLLMLIFTTLYINTN